MKTKDLEKLLTYFGNEWAKALDAWMIVRGEKRREKLLKWAVKKIKEVRK